MKLFTLPLCGIAFGSAVVLSSFVVSAPASAQTTPAPAAAAAPTAPAGGCLVSPARVSDDALSSFKSNPGALLSRHPVGGLGMATEVRGLAGSDASTIASIVDLAKTAGQAQRASMGAGLAQASFACLRTRQDVAQYIQQMVALAGLPDMMTAFMAGAGAFDTAALGSVGAVGGGVGGAIGGGGSIGGGGGSGTGGNNGASGARGGDGFSFSAGGGGSVSDTTSNNVSPFR